jgi:predicted GH43/DUF377 family glycosyl hydrolase
VKWRKQGLVYAPDGSIPWAQKHAFPPTPVRLHEGEIRIYLSFTDSGNVGRLAYIDVDATNPKRILRISERPLLDVGQPGAFDDNGVVPTSVVRIGDRLFLYYVGFQLGHRVRYFQFQGLAISDDGGETFHRHRRTPIIERSEQELVNRTSAFVMHEDGRFRMWYVGGSEWTSVGEKALPVYEIRYLESPDGVTWGAEGRVAIHLKDADEHALGRAWVLPHDGRYRMFFSRRSRSLGYRIGYAESEDGITWRRDDDRIGLDVSPEGWDSKMVAYTGVIEGDGSWYLFYNGNDCGQSGFGYATLEEW